jgi:high-affinity iron transporter
MATSTVHQPSLSAPAEAPSRLRGLPWWLAAVLFLPILALLVWQGVTAAGSPDPTVAHTGRGSAILDISVLVFREGLETILVLAAITAGLARKNENSAHVRPIFAGAGLGIVASIITWFVVRGIVSDLTTVVPALALQAATGLLAVVVLLVVMNWFFHKVYWGGWISLHNRQKRKLLGAAESRHSPTLLFWGLVLLGMSSVYREGFEIVLFLQSYYLKMGHDVVYIGGLIGAALTGVMAVLTFWAHTRLPYRKMLIATGVLLGIVLLVMVGEEANEMQLANWISTTPIHWLDGKIPDWAGVWFSIFPNWETFIAQGIAAVLVVGSYFLSGRLMKASEVPAPHAA